MVKTPGFESGLDSDIVYLCEPRQRSLPRDHVIPHLDSVVNACLFIILFFFFSRHWFSFQESSFLDL